MTRRFLKSIGYEFPRFLISPLSLVATGLL